MSEADDVEEDLRESLERLRDAREGCSGMPRTHRHIQEAIDSATVALGRSEHAE